MKNHCIVRPGSRRPAALKPLAAALLSLGWLGAPWAAANLPQGPSLEGGNVGIGASGSLMTLTQTTPPLGKASACAWCSLRRRACCSTG